MNGAPWDSAADAELVSLLADKRVKYTEIGRRLGRTSVAIQKRVFKLGVGARRPNIRRWTQEERAQLMDLLAGPRLTIREIALRMDRTPDSITTQMYEKLGVRKRDVTCARRAA